MHLSELITALGQLVPPTAIVTEAEALKPFSYDWIPGSYRLPDLVVRPTHPDQVAAIVALIAQTGLPIVARGAGTGLAGGARPSQGGVVLDMSQMNQIEQVDLANRQARVQPGLITYALSAALAETGWFYAPDPASWRMCTIGGNLANNSGGPRCLKYGVTTNHVLALEVVDQRGQPYWTGDGVTDVAGYDLTGLIIGSEGTFGLITRAIVRLTRSPEANRVAMALFPDVVQACAAVSAILAAGHLPTALEVMDATTMRAVNLAQGANLPEQAGAALIIEIDGVHEGLDADLAELVALCRNHGAFTIETATSPQAQERLWSARRSAFASFHTLAPSYYLVDTVVPRTRLPAMMAHVQRLSEQYGLPIANVFHAGDGNLHPLVLYDPADPAQVAKAHAITNAVLAQSIAEGGAVSGEHGIGVEKQDFLARLYGPAELAAQALVYAIFNPERRLNPGKVFPHDTDPLALAAARQADLARPSWAIPRAQLWASLVETVGADHCLTGAKAAAYPVQGHLPGCVVLPGTLAELSAVMRHCHRAGVTVVPWGGGTKQQTGPLNEAPEVIVSLQRLNAVVHYEPADLTIGVEAGMTLATLQRLLAEQNQQLPLLVPAAEQATLGGLVATATDGPERPGYGTLRDQVLGLTVVQVDGTILRLGGQVVKNVSGYDLTRLMIGSHGTLGLIAEVRLRTYPRPAATASLVAGFAHLAAFAATLQTLNGSVLRPTAADYLDQGTLATLGLAGDYGLALRFAGNPAACQRQLGEAEQIAHQHGARAMLIAQGETEEQLWHHSVARTAPLRDPAAYQLRLAVPPAAFCTALAALEQQAARHGIALTVGGRAMHGLLNAGFVTDPLTAAAFQQDLLADWPHCQLVAGSLPSEAEAWRWGQPAAPMVQTLQNQLKAAFDPHDQLNRGRYVVRVELATPS